MVQFIKKDYCDLNIHIIHEVFITEKTKPEAVGTISNVYSYYSKNTGKMSFSTTDAKSAELSKT